MEPAVLCRALFALVNASSWSFVYFEDKRHVEHRRNFPSLSEFIESPECGKHSAIIYSRIDELRDFALRSMINRRWVFVIVLHMTASQTLKFQSYASELPLSRWLFTEDSHQDLSSEYEESFARCISSRATGRGISVPIDWRSCAHAIVDVVQPESTRFQLREIVSVCCDRCTEFGDIDHFSFISKGLNVSESNCRYTHGHVKTTGPQMNEEIFEMQRTRQADISLRLMVMSYDRLSKIEYIKEVYWGYVSFYTYRRADERAGFAGLVTVFSGRTWFALGLLFLACVVMGILFCECADTIDVSVRMFLQQPCERPFLNIMIAHLLIILGTFVVSSVFKQALLSHLQVPIPTTLQTEKDFEDALKRGSGYRVCIRDNDYMTELINSSMRRAYVMIRSPRYQHRLIRRHDEISCLHQYPQESVISVFLDCRLCRFARYLSPGREGLEHLISSYTVAPDFPWKRRLNLVLRRLFEADWFGKHAIQRSWKRREVEIERFSPDDAQDLNLEEFRPIMLILVAGYLLATAVEVVSLIRNCIHPRKKPVHRPGSYPIYYERRPHHSDHYYHRFTTRD